MLNRTLGHTRSESHSRAPGLKRRRQDPFSVPWVSFLHERLGPTTRRGKCPPRTRNSRTVLFAGERENECTIRRRSGQNAFVASAETKGKWTELYGRLISEKEAEINGRKDRFWTGAWSGRTVRLQSHCGICPEDKTGAMQGSSKVKAAHRPQPKIGEPIPLAGSLCNA